MISIIIPAYNSAATIVEALDSVLAQTIDPRPQTIDLCEAPGSNVNGLKSNVSPRYEVIIVDDCSKDNTVEVVRDWIAQRSPSNTSHVSRFTLHTLPANGGPAKARNSGIAAARGDWIAFLDADDIWLPGKLELQMRLAAQHPEVVLWCGETIGFQGEANRLSDNCNSLLVNKTNIQEPITNNNLRTLTLEDLALRNSIATSTVLVKRDAVLAVGGFDTQFRGPEDYDLWIRIAAYAGVAPSVQNSPGRIVHFAAPVSLYRRTVGSLSLDDRKFLPQVMRVLEKSYGVGGALAHLPHLKNAALSSQYWSGSWMAFSRGSRLDAIGLWWRAWRLNLHATPGVKRPWFRMLIRYGCLPRPH